MQRCARTLLAAAAASLAAAAGADPARLADAQVAYQKERAACIGGRSNQDRETGLKEAGAALQQARRGGRGDDQADIARNRMLRCEQQRPEDRADCVRRMNSEGYTSGSVEAGGIYRELVTKGVPARAE